MFLDNFEIRACYSDTDAAGVIHHARLLEMFERSRTEWLRRIGADPKSLSQESNLLLVIREVNLQFHAPGALEDLMVFSHLVIKRGNSQFVLEQKAFRSPPLQNKDLGDPQLLCTGTFHLVCVSTATMKSHPLPNNIPGPSPL